MSIACLIEEPYAVVQQVGQGILQGTLGAGDKAQRSGQLLEPWPPKRPSLQEVCVAVCVCIWRQICV